MEESNGYKGYRLVDGGTNATHLVAPSGVKLAVFQKVAGRQMPLMKSLVDGLDCGENHKTEEHAVKYMVDRYERLTTTVMERLRKRVCSVFSHGGWGALAAIASVVAAVAAVVAATVSILTYINTLS